MIITRTPFRVSFLGGGTDYPDWYTKHGGSILSAAIDKYCYISLRELPPFFAHKNRIVYSKIENVNNFQDIQHPVVREVLKWKGGNSGFEIHHDGDLPARSGTGSSSAFTVGLLRALYAHKGLLVDTLTLAREAIYVEQTLLNETVGVQDQIAVAVGGLNHIKIGADGNFSVDPIPINAEFKQELEQHVILCFSGQSRFSSDVAEATVNSLELKKSNIKNIQSLVDLGIDALIGQDLKRFGELISESWQLKRAISTQITSEDIDLIWSAATKLGAFGGKLLGAGGGGFLLFVAPPSTQRKLMDKFRNLVFVSVKIDSHGSVTTVYHP